MVIPCFSMPTCLFLMKDGYLGGIRECIEHLSSWNFAKKKGGNTEVSIEKKQTKQGMLKGQTSLVRQMVFESSQVCGVLKKATCEEVPLHLVVNK